MKEKEYIKEYEEMSLYDFADELVEPLFIVKQDLTKTIYIHYAEERDKRVSKRPWILEKSFPLILVIESISC